MFFTLSPVMTGLSSSQESSETNFCCMKVKSEKANSKILEDKKHTQTESCKLKIKYF